MGRFNNTLCAMLAVIVLQHVPTSLASCVSVANWNQFRRAVGSSSTEILFCPFNIRKPSSQTLQINNVVKDLACSESKKCTIRGEGTQIQIRGEGARLRLTGIRFRDATDSVIRIAASSNQQHEIHQCVFRNNYGPLESSGRGGAIRAEAGTQVLITSTRFLDNRARLGGAIFHLGSSLVIEDTIFKENVAHRGGAIFIPSKNAGTTLTVTNTNFLSNIASGNPSGAINVGNLDRITAYIDDASTGANNNCNGVYDDGRNACNDFAIASNTAGYVLGKLTKLDDGLRLSQGLTARIIASSGELVNFTSIEAGTAKSSIPFHTDPDGAAVYELGGNRGGYVYVSNSEAPDGKGGVFGLEFDRDGNVRDYKDLLSDFQTNRNCNGGRTPWNTWVSCEEADGGQCWQVDPTGRIDPEPTVLGGADGGFFEAFAYDDRNPDAPVFYVTEDVPNGALRRFRPDDSELYGWSMLHGKGTIDYLQILDDNKFRWTSSLSKGRQSAQDAFQHCEGIAYLDGILMFVSKTQKELFRLDLQDMTYTVETTRAPDLEGGGSFGSGPDHLLVDSAGYLFFTEDGGSTPGVFAYDGSEYLALLEADSERYNGDETTGIAFSPDRKFLFVCIQEYGVLFQVSREDGLPFDSHRVLQWKVDLGRV